MCLKFTFYSKQQLSGSFREEWDQITEDKFLNGLGTHGFVIFGYQYGGVVSLEDVMNKNLIMSTIITEFCNKSQVIILAIM